MSNSQFWVGSIIPLPSGTLGGEARKGLLAGCQALCEPGGQPPRDGGQAAGTEGCRLQGIKRVGRKHNVIPLGSEPCPACGLRRSEPQAHAGWEGRAPAQLPGSSLLASQNSRVGEQPLPLMFPKTDTLDWLDGGVSCAPNEQ